MNKGYTTAATPAPSNTSEEDASLLIVVLDLNPLSWGARSPSISDTERINFTSFLEHIQVFLNAFLLLSPQNMLAVIASKVGGSSYLYPPPSSEAFEHSLSPVKYILQQLKKVANDEYPQYKNSDETANGDPASQPSSSSSSPPVTSTCFSAALALALCYAHRISKLPRTGATGAIKPRILAVQVSGDVTSQYIPVMNCIFSAQRQNVVIDGCALGPPSSFLQQAASLTAGIYLQPISQTSLAQYLIYAFLADMHARKILKIPRQLAVDFQASCFCHKTPLTIGYVCSVCLSIFCNSSLTCSTCGTKFALPLKR